MEKIGIDIGATLTKVVENGRRYRLATGDDPVKVVELIVAGRAVDVRATGCMAMKLPKRIGDARITVVPEFKAISAGGWMLSGAEDGILATVGTGTSVIRLRDGEHLGGTGVGCGTLLGLSKAMLGVDDADELARLAAEGDRSKVNLLVGDICPLPIGHLLESVTASNMAKLRKVAGAEASDIAAGLYSLVGEVVATVSVFIAKAQGLDSVIYAGGGIVDPVLKKLIEETTKFWGLKPEFLADPIYVGAIGAYNMEIEP